MDFRLTEEQKLVRDTARDFVDRELIQHVREWEEKGEVPRSFYRKMASLGFLGAPVPEKYGGGGMDFAPFLLPPRGNSRRGASVPPTSSLPTAPRETPPPLCAPEAPTEKTVGPPPPA